MNGVDVSVLIPVFNEARILRETASAMFAQRFEGEMEFLFIDGRSTDETPAILESLRRQDPRVRLLDNPARLQGAALNLGLRSARGEFVVRMDAHAFYPPDYVALGVERLRQGDVTWVAGPQISAGIDAGSRRVATAMRSPLGVGGARFRSMPDEEIETDSGFTGVWRRRTLIEHGGWDEGATPNEDGELAARIRARNGRIVCLPRMAARSITRASVRSLARQYWRYGMYRARTVIDYPRSLRPSQLLPPALVAIVPAALIAPGPLAWVARAALGLYALTVLVESIRVGGATGPRDALGLLLVFPTMHLCWGAGFLVGAARFAPGRRRRRRARKKPL